MVNLLKHSSKPLSPPPSPLPTPTLHAPLQWWIWLKHSSKLLLHPHLPTTPPTHSLHAPPQRWIYRSTGITSVSSCPPPPTTTTLPSPSPCPAAMMVDLQKHSSTPLSPPPPPHTATLPCPPPPHAPLQWWICSSTQVNSVHLFILMIPSQWISVNKSFDSLDLVRHWLQLSALPMLPRALCSAEARRAPVSLNSPSLSPSVVSGQFDFR